MSIDTSIRESAGTAFGTTVDAGIATTGVARGGGAGADAGVGTTGVTTTGGDAGVDADVGTGIDAGLDAGVETGGGAGADMGVATAAGVPDSASDRTAESDGFVRRRDQSGGPPVNVIAHFANLQSYGPPRLAHMSGAERS